MTRFAEVRRLGGDRYQAWLDAGYREHVSRGSRSTDLLLQRSFADAAGTRLFFVDVWVYDWSEFSWLNGPPVTFFPTAQFNCHGDQPPAFNVELLDERGPAETEAFFRRMYEAMGAEPYGD